MIFVHRQLAPSVGNRVISHITVSKKKSSMVQTRLMATINQETENPSNAMERQVQTLTMIVERLTQRNQEFEQQLNQRNEQRPNDQHDK